MDRPTFIRIIKNALVLFHFIRHRHTYTHRNTHTHIYIYIYIYPLPNQAPSYQDLIIGFCLFGRWQSPITWCCAQATYFNSCKSYDYFMCSNPAVCISITSSHHPIRRNSYIIVHFDLELSRLLEPSRTAHGGNTSCRYSPQPKMAFCGVVFHLNCV